MRPKKNHVEALDASFVLQTRVVLRRVVEIFEGALLPTPYYFSETYEKSCIGHCLLLSSWTTVHSSVEERTGSNVNATLPIGPRRALWHLPEHLPRTSVAGYEVRRSLRAARPEAAMRSVAAVRRWTRGGSIISSADGLSGLQG